VFDSAIVLTSLLWKHVLYGVVSNLETTIAQLIIMFNTKIVTLGRQTYARYIHENYICFGCVNHHLIAG
jgi:hypothetical protein